MKTRNIWIAALLLMGAAGHAAAQQTGDQPQKTRIETRGDSIIIRKGAGDLRIKVYEQQGDESSQEEVEIYEGVWLEKVDADKRNFLDALPFIPGKKRKNDYEPHVSGIYIGFSRLADNFLGFGASPQARLDLSASWEFGFNLLCTYHQFKKKIEGEMGEDIRVAHVYCPFRFRCLPRLLYIHPGVQQIQLCL